MLYGNVPEEHREAVKKLLEQEASLEEHIEMLPKYVAQGYICLAHDWYEMNMEEEGQRLLLRANAVCPGYFKEHMIKHTEENQNFRIIVIRLQAMVKQWLIDELKGKIK